jgi:hypothetical protein
VFFKREVKNVSKISLIFSFKGEAQKKDIVIGFIAKKEKKKKKRKIHLKLNERS